MSASSYLGRIAARSASDGPFVQGAPLEPARTPFAEPTVTEDRVDGVAEAQAATHGSSAPEPLRERALRVSEPFMAPSPAEALGELRSSPEPPAPSSLPLDRHPVEPVTEPLPFRREEPLQVLMPRFTGASEAASPQPFSVPLQVGAEPSPAVAEVPQPVALPASGELLQPDPSPPEPFERVAPPSQAVAAGPLEPEPAANESDVAARVAAALARMDQLLRPEPAPRAEPQPAPTADGTRVTIGRVRVEVVSPSPPAPSRAAATPRGVSAGATLGGLPSKLRFGLGQV